MKRLIEFPLQNGGMMLVEIDEPETETGVVKAGINPSEIATKAKQTLEDALENIKPMADSIIGKLRELHDAPDEVSVEFGIKLSAEAGAFLASAGIEANYTVTLKWAKR